MKRVFKILIFLCTMWLVAITVSASSVTPIDLETNSSAYRINNNGQIVGFCDNATGVQPCYWENSTNAPKDLRTLGGIYSYANGINNNGQIVGSSYNATALHAPKSPKVFISYTHDSPIHMERVLKLSNRLRSEGIDCSIDQYETSPSEGWPRWMINQIEAANFVLVVCTEKYDKRFKGKDEAGKGLGANFEGFVITQEIYETEVKNTKFIPVIFSSEDSSHIPIILKSATHYNLDTERGYDELYARLTSKILVQKPLIRELRKLSTKDTPPFEGQ